MRQGKVAKKTECDTILSRVGDGPIRLTSGTWVAKQKSGWANGLGMNMEPEVRNRWKLEINLL